MPRARRTAAAAATADKEQIDREVRDALEQAAEVLKADRPRNKDLRDALLDLTNCIHKDPANAKCYAERARLYVRLNEPKLALFDLTMAIQMEEPLGRDDHKLAAFYGARGQCFRHLGKLEDSLCDFKRARHYDSKSDNGQWFYEMGVSFSDLGDKWRALEMFSLALGDGGASAGNNNNAPSSSGANNNNRGDATSPTASTAAPSRYGAQQQQQQQQKDKGPKLKRDEKINCLVYRGNTYRELGALAESIEDLKRAVELEPESASHHNILGLSYFEQQDYKSAGAMFAKAVELDPSSSIYHNNLGLSNFQQGQHSTSKYAEAFDNFRTAVALEEQKLKDTAKTDEERKKCNITLANMYFNKGNAALSMDQIENALDDFDQAIARDPEDENVYHAKGIAYQNSKPEPRVQAAIQQFQKALSLNPTFKPSLFHMGLMYHSDNKPFKAMDCLAKDDMELLTDTGFVGYAEARLRYNNNSLIVAGYDQNTRRLVYEKPSVFVDEPGAPADRMYEITTRAGYSVKVSGNHRLLMEVDDALPWGNVKKRNCRLAGLGPVTPTIKHILGHVKQPDGAKWPSGMKADEPFAQPRHELGDDDPLYFMAAALNGLEGGCKIRDCAPIADLAPAWAQAFDKIQIERDVCELLGFWLGDDGSLHSVKRRSITFCQAKASDTIYLRERLLRIGLKPNVDFFEHSHGATAGSTHFHVVRPSWLTFFFREFACKYEGGLLAAHQLGVAADAAAAWRREFGCDPPSDEQIKIALARHTDDIVRDNRPLGTPSMGLEDGDAAKTTIVTITTTTPPPEPPIVQSSKWFWPWVWKLDQRYCLWLLSGLMEADGHSGRSTDESNSVFTSSVSFRDAVLRLAFHAGRSTSYHRMYKAGDCRGKAQNGLDIKAERDNWQVHVSIPRGAFAAPMFCRSDIKEVQGYSQGVWCVTMPRTGNIVVRRCHPQAAAEGLSYRPVIIGNCFAQVAKADPTDRRAFENIGLVYCDLLYFDLAVGAFTRAIEILPTNAVMYFYRGKALLWLGRYEAATADFNRAVELGCEEPQVYNNRALSYKYQKRYGDAIADLTKAISITAGAANSTTATAAESAAAAASAAAGTEFWYNRAMCYAETGQYPKAVADLSEALKIDNSQHRLFFLRGKCAYLMGKYQEALIDLRHARAAQPNAPDAPEAYYYMGLSHARLDEYAHALQNFSEAVARKPNCAHYVHERAKALQHEGKYEEAVQDFTKVLALQPLNAHALFRRAFAFKSINRFAEASEDFENARKLQPLNHHLVVNFKKIYEVAFVALCSPGDEPPYEEMVAVAEAARATAHVR